MSSEYIKVLKLQRSKRRLTELHEIVGRDVVAQLHASVQETLHAAAGRLRELLEATPEKTRALSEVIADLSKASEQIDALGRQLYPATLSQGFASTFQASAQKEGLKSSLRAAMDRLEPEGLLAKDELLPLQPGESVPEMGAIAREIDGLYDQIRDLISARAGDPGLKEAVHPLRIRLHALQQQEAEAMELRFRKPLRFDPREGRKLIREIQDRLRKQ